MHAVAEGQVPRRLTTQVEPVGVGKCAGSRLAAGTESTTGSPARMDRPCRVTSSVATRTSPNWMIVR